MPKGPPRFRQSVSRLDQALQTIELQAIDLPGIMLAGVDPYDRLAVLQKGIQNK